MQLRWLAVAAFAIACFERREAAPRHTETVRQPLISAEVMLDPHGAGPVVFFASSPALAWANGHYLAAWEDTRTGERRIYLARVDRAGVSLDGIGFALRSVGSGQYNPRLACTAASCLLAFHSDTGVSVWRLGLDGQPLDADPAALPQLGQVYGPSALATDGVGWVVVSANQASGPVVATAVSSSGVVSPAVMLSPDARDRVVGVTFRGADYLVLFTDQSDAGQAVFATTFVPPATAGTPRRVTGGPYDGEPSVAWNGALAAVAFDHVGSAYNEIWGFVLYPDGGPPQPPTFLVNASCPTAIDPYGAVIAATPQGFWSAWSYGTGAPVIAASRRASDGSLLDGIDASVVDDLDAGELGSFNPSIACEPDAGCLLAWDHSDRYSLSYRVHLTRLSWAGGPLDIPNRVVPIDIAGLGEQSAPRLACRGDTCMALWREVSFDGGITGVRFHVDGGIVDARSVHLSRARLASDALLFATGADFTALWSEGGGVAGGVLHPDGGVDGPLLVVDGGPYGLSVHAGHDGEQLWYLQHEQTTTRILLHRIALDGGLRVTQVRAIGTAGSSGYEQLEAVASGPYTLLEWRGAQNAELVRIDRAGNVIDTAPLTVDGGRFGPLSPDPLGWLWFEPAPAAVVRRIGLDGGIGPAVALDVPDAATALTVAFDGVNHLMLWNAPAGSSRGTFAEYLDTDGVSQGPAFSLPVPFSAPQPVAARVAEGEVVVAYARYDDTAGVLDKRVFARWVNRVDAGRPPADAGVGPDGGATTSDAGALPDAGSPADGGVTGSDGGTSDSDGGVIEAPRELHLTCGCEATGPGLLLLALVVELHRVGRRKPRVVGR